MDGDLASGRNRCESKFPLVLEDGSLFHSRFLSCPFFEKIAFRFSARFLKRTSFFLILLLGLECFQLAVGEIIHDLQQGKTPLFSSFRTQFFDAARWCRDHTPKDSLFVIPPYRGGFRGESLRSVFVSWDEQVALMVAPDYIPEYDHRLRLLGIQPLSHEDLDRMWYPTREELLSVRDEYGADYIVIESFKLLSFPLVYENSGYCVYQLNPE